MLYAGRPAQQFRPVAPTPSDSMKFSRRISFCFVPNSVGEKNPLAPVNRSPCAPAAAPTVLLSRHPPSPQDEPRGPRRRSEFSVLARPLQLSSPLPSHQCSGGHGPRKTKLSQLHVGGLQLDKFMRKLPAKDCGSTTHGCNTKARRQFLHQFSCGIAASPKQEVPASRIADCSKRKSHIQQKNKSNKNLQYSLKKKIAGSSKI